MPRSPTLRPISISMVSPTQKITYTQSYPTTANWKLVVENFVECYHCASAHPEFCSMHPRRRSWRSAQGPVPVRPMRGEVSAHGESLGAARGCARPPDWHGR